MKITALIISFLLFLSLTVQCQQNSADVFQIESWKKGNLRIEEQKLHIELNVNKPVYEKKIKDSTGIERYKLTIGPGRAGGSNSAIVEWLAELVEVVPKKTKNLLAPTNDSKQDYFTAKDRIWWLYPIENPKSEGAEETVVPFLAKRIVKIEYFYCIIQVKKYRLNKNSAFESLTVDVEFTNVRPNCQAQSNKSMDVRAKQRLCYQSLSLNSELRVSGFAPRHLNRSAANIRER